MNEISVMPSNFVMQSLIQEAATKRRTMKIIRAAHMGMCFGVRDAIAKAIDESSHRPLTILGDLVHNESVLQDLRSRGIAIETQAAAVQTSAVMITAHGASDKTMAQARSRGLEVHEATCPLVHFAHRAVRQLVQQGYHPVIIGQRGHVEVRGITEDLNEFDIVLSEEDVLALKEHPRFGVAAQTTQPLDKVRRLAELIRQRFSNSEVRLVDTVCQPTKQRQSAAVELARQSDVVIVIGGANSNNTRELAATCGRYCENAHHVQGPEDLQLDWFAAAATVGITAGTSTPDILIDSVENWLRANL